jgi:hypothetical protein
LIKIADEFILFDTPQYIRHGWIERNRILKLDGDPLYFKVPLQKHKRETAIKDIVINNDVNWKNKIKAQLGSYKKNAPYFYQVIELLDRIFEKEYTSIVVLNFDTLRTICDYLEIQTSIKIWSEMGVAIEEVNAPDEWALNICKALDADSYYNPPGGIDFFDRKKYKSSGIEIKFLEYKPESYKQLSDEFVPYLSILDVLMFNSKEEIQKMLNSYELI